MIVLFKAIWFLSFIFASSVKLKKKGTFPMVSIATKNNINEFIKFISEFEILELETESSNLSQTLLEYF